MKIKYCNYCQVICHPTPFLEVVVCTKYQYMKTRRQKGSRKTTYRSHESNNCHRNVTIKGFACHHHFLEGQIPIDLIRLLTPEKKAEKTDMLCNSLLLYSITPNTFRLNTYWAFFSLTYKRLNFFPVYCCYLQLIDEVIENAYLMNK